MIIITLLSEKAALKVKGMRCIPSSCLYTYYLYSLNTVIDLVSYVAMQNAQQ